MLTKKDLEHLGELARIEIPSRDEKKLLQDLEKILAYFEELKEVDTASVEPVSGGTFSKNVFRTDELGENRLLAEKAVVQFPEKDKGFLKVPPVFE